MERGSREGGYQGPQAWRRKGGLETPLEGRLFKEETRLTFAPPRWYDLLVLTCVFGAIALGVASLLGHGFLGDELKFGVFVVVMVFSAGIWAGISNERMICDIRANTYARLEGSGLRMRMVKGSLAQLQALVLMSEEYPLPMLGSRLVIYRLVLYWKGNVQPLLIVERKSQNLALGAPINQMAGPLLQKALKYGQVLKIPVYDNSHVHSGGRCLWSESG